MPKFELVKAGDLLYERRRVRMGNTTMRQTVVYPVKILSIDHEKGTASVSWNHPMNLSRPQAYRQRDVERLTRTEPKGRSK